MIVQNYDWEQKELLVILANLFSAANISWQNNINIEFVKMVITS